MNGEKFYSCFDLEEKQFYLYDHNIFISTKKIKNHLIYYDEVKYLYLKKKIKYLYFSFGNIWLLNTI